MDIRKDISRYLLDEFNHVRLYMRAKEGDGLELYDPLIELDDYRDRDIRDRSVVVTIRGQPVPHNGHVLLLERAKGVADATNSDLYAVMRCRKGPRDPVQDPIGERQKLLQDVLRSEGFDMSRVKVEANPDVPFYEEPQCMAFRIMNPIAVTSRERWDIGFSKERPDSSYFFVHDGIEEYPMMADFPLDRDPKDRKVSGHHISEMLIMLPKHPEYEHTLMAILPEPSFEKAMEREFADKIREYYANFPDAEEFMRTYPSLPPLRPRDLEHIARMKRLIR